MSYTRYKCYCDRCRTEFTVDLRYEDLECPNCEAGEPDVYCIGTYTVDDDDEDEEDWEDGEA